VSLVNTTWSGTESGLSNYGKLSFQLLANGVVIMTDKDGRNQGTWTQNGSTVTLTFYNGTCTYQGTVAGQTFSGTGRLANGVNWSFNLTRQG
jgi:hypothetical protein